MRVGRGLLQRQPIEAANAQDVTGGSAMGAAPHPRFPWLGLGTQ
ncbi:hypothetical protein ACWGI9_32810 [Streptomyces sp. NPDC054833]|jgi:hypothetical protein